MSRSVIQVPPQDMQISKSLSVKFTNPKFVETPVSNAFTIKWDKIEKAVREKTGRFFKIYGMETTKGNANLQLNFKVYKNSPIDYEAILDAIQELFPEEGVQGVST